jgi:formylglycine-generating enzyme required for sulfatase activity
MRKPLQPGSGLRVRGLLLPLVSTLAPLACTGHHGDVDSRPRVVGPQPPAPAAATAEVAFAIAAGACAGKSVGDPVCDGDRLLRCADPGGEAVEERRCLGGIERCDAVEGACAPACPSGSVYIPATGPLGFMMGKGFMTHGATSYRVGKGHRPDTDKPHRVVLTRPFCMDEREVTVGEIQPCIDAGACQRPNPARFFVTYPTRPDYPVNSIEWISARNFCARAGKSLPTEAQWEWAATGSDGRAWPWGNETPSCERADFTAGELVSPGGDSGCHGGGPSRVGAHPAGDRIWPSGRIHDLAGNVWEWCLDSYLPYPDKDEIDPLHLDVQRGTYVVRGGGWNRSGRGIMAAFRGAAITPYTVPGLGLRCVRNAEAEAAGGAAKDR